MDPPKYEVPIRYCCVSYCGRALVSHQTEPDNYPQIVQQVVKTLDLQPAAPEHHRKITIPIDRFQVHVLFCDHLFYCCVTLRTRHVYQPFIFLKTVREKFSEKPILLTQAPTAAEHEFDPVFGPVLATIMYDYNVGCAGYQETSLQFQVDEVKQLMLENLAKMVERGERVEDLLTTADHLQAQASCFQHVTHKLEERLVLVPAPASHVPTRWWRNTAMWIVIGGILVLTIVIAALLYFRVIKVRD